MEQFQASEEVETTSLVTYNTRCPKCHDIPLLYLSNREYKVNIICKHCNYNDNLNIGAYIKNTEGSCIKNKKCNKHKIDLISLFCFECKKHLCNHCDKKEHYNHHLFDLSGKIRLKELSKSYQKAKNHLDIYCTILKDKIVAKLNNEINKVVNSYNSFYENNNNILLLTQTVMNNYSSLNNNYYLTENLLNLREFNISK